MCVGGCCVIVVVQSSKIVSSPTSVSIPILFTFCLGGTVFGTTSEVVHHKFLTVSRVDPIHESAGQAMLLLLKF